MKTAVTATVVEHCWPLVCVVYSRGGSESSYCCNPQFLLPFTAEYVCLWVSICLSHLLVPFQRGVFSKKRH